MADEDIIVITMIITENEKTPYLEWLASLKDKTAKARVSREVQKLSRGLGNIRRVNDFFELKIDVGPGYRVYFARVQKAIVLLLGAGDKSTQAKDITDASQLLESFKKAGKPERAMLILGAVAQAREALADPQDADNALAPSSDE